MSFLTICDATIHEEGGFSDHPDDDGGATKFGISLGFFRLLDPDSTPDDIRSLTLDGARAIYKEHFWRPIRGDDLPAAIALAVFDMAVTSGVGDAAKALQAAVGALEDGIIGSQTILALNAVIMGRSVARVLTEIHTIRLRKFASNDDFEVFGDGWFSRTLRIHALALRMG